MSTRNGYLSPEERLAATALYRALSQAAKRIEAGEREVPTLLAEVREIIEAEPRARLQYAELRDADTLAALGVVEGRVVLAVAAFFGSARLIDNVLVAAPKV
jgi:pantoate--beta-alanine ligase